MASLKSRISGSELRSYIALAATAGLFVGILAGPVLANSPKSPSLDPTTGTPAEHTISVSGEGKISLTPDVADVSLGISVQKSKASDARDAAAQIMQAVIAALHGLGVADADIQTSQLDLNPIYNYNNSQSISGYQMDNVVTVHVRDLTKLADVIDQSVAAGATNVNSVTFDVSDRTQAEADARTAAVKDARAHADALAAAAGVTITGVQSITESSASTYPWPRYAFGPTAGDAATPPTPIQPGTTDLTIDVSVVYVIG